MKTTLLVAVLAISFVACKKDPFTVPDVTPQPSLQAKVYPFVNQPSTDMMANELNIPQQLQGANFVFANVDLGEEFAGKTLSIKAQVSGGQTVSDDDVKNAFTVEL
jgi:hypothetical protein